MDIERYTVNGRKAALYMADSKDSPLVVLNNYMVIPLVQLRVNRCGATVCPILEWVCFATEIRI